MENNQISKSRGEKYTKIKELGGKYPTSTFLCKGKDSQDLVIMKSTDMSHLTAEVQKSAMKEAKIMKVLCHPNIIQVRDVYATTNHKLCVVMANADGGDLQSYLETKKSSGYLSEQEVLTKFTQICLAVKFLHDRNVEHKQIKASNILMTKEGICKLTDIKINALESLEMNVNFATEGQTLHQFPPEQLSGVNVAKKGDIWALGVILYQLCTFNLPFEARSVWAYAKQIGKATFEPIAEHFSSDMKNLINALLDKDYEKRPKIKEILEKSMIQDKIGGIIIDHNFKSEFSDATLLRDDFYKLKNDQNREQLEIIEDIYTQNFTPTNGQLTDNFNQQYLAFVSNLLKNEISIPDLSQQYLFPGTTSLPCQESQLISVSIESEMKAPIQAIIINQPQDQEAYLNSFYMEENIEN